ncbi:MAG: Holliday junction branch migration DNA helicase RuvB [Candidatus Eremiobacteraeota bacterium]|nr:Holliday junction branch migration DNA helicase RuvB [Candidatus Eremiobacteraeota bacterium]
MKQKLLSLSKIEEDIQVEQTLRPTRLDEYMGQTRIKENLIVFIKAALKRKEALDHVLLYGAPGLGKTTMAHIIANELGVGIKTTSGPAIERPLDLLIMLKSLKPRDVLFIDEIHRLSRVVEEILYPSMEDFSFDKVLSKAGSTKSTRVKLPPFTLIGATTRSGLISSPLRDRFGIVFSLSFYSDDELTAIIKRSARILGISIQPDAAREIARRSRGTPRIVNRLLRRVRDFAQVKGDGKITMKVTKIALEKLGIDSIGLDEIDRRILETLIFTFKGKPVGIETLAACLSEESQNLEEVYEPYLLQLGLINKTPRGRVAAPRAYRHFGITEKEELQGDLFGNPW